MKIVIDPGHWDLKNGVADPGAVDGVNPAEGDELKTVEHELTFDIATRLMQILFNLKHEVFLSRNNGQLTTLTARTDYANRIKADLFISIHLNAAGDTKARGIETFCYPGSQDGYLLAKCIQEEVMDRFKDWVNRGAKEANFSVLRRSDMPAALIECGFITNPDEEKKINDSYVRERFAMGIAAGIQKYAEKVKA